MRGSREISLVPSLHRASTDALIECVELAREPLRHPINRQETDKMRKKASETP